MRGNTLLVVAGLSDTPDWSMGEGADPEFIANLRAMTDLSFQQAPTPGLPVGAKTGAEPPADAESKPEEPARVSRARERFGLDSGRGRSRHQVRRTATIRDATRRSASVAGRRGQGRCALRISFVEVARLVAGRGRGRGRVGARSCVAVPGVVAGAGTARGRSSSALTAASSPTRCSASDDNAQPARQHRALVGAGPRQVHHRRCASRTGGVLRSAAVLRRFAPASHAVWLLGLWLVFVLGSRRLRPAARDGIRSISPASSAPPVASWRACCGRPRRASNCSRIFSTRRACESACRPTVRRCGIGSLRMPRCRRSDIERLQELHAKVQQGRRVDLSQVA